MLSQPELARIAIVGTGRDQPSLAAAVRRVGFGRVTVVNEYSLILC